MRQCSCVSALLETTGAAKPRSAARRLTHSLPINVRFEINGLKRIVALTHQNQHRYDAEIEGQRFELNLIEIGGSSVRFTCDGVMESAAYSRDGVTLLLRYRGQSFEIQDQTRAASVRQEGAGGTDGSYAHP